MAKKSVEALIAETLEIPTFPPAARKVIELTDRESTSTADLEQILSKDQGIALRVLSFVNSAYFNTGRRVDTILDAIMLIGFQMLRALVVGASVRNLFRKFGATEKNLWEHSVLASLASSSVARVKKEVPIELALVAGLIHDVGKVVLNNSMPHEYDEITASGRRHGELLLQSESRVFGFNHGDVGALLLRAWDLPENLRMVAQSHHYDDCPSLAEEDRALCRVVALGNAAAVAVSLDGATLPETETEAFSQIGLSGSRVKDLLHEIRSLLNEQKNYFMA
jgi:putative nucleotidyltransferase with HDIG domain